MKKKLEAYLLSILEERKKAPILKGGLLAISWLFHLLVWLRSKAYDLGWLKTHKVPAFVVSIGNIVAGGTGKTPFLKRLLQELALPEGAAAILTRGYRSGKEGEVHRIQKGDAVADCGDEPYWLSLQTNAGVWVGRDRLSSAKLAWEDGASFLFLDDGFQHRRLERDLDFVLLDASDPFGLGFFLPRGFLRDSPSRLREADFLVLTHMEKIQEPEFSSLLQSLERLSNAPVIGFSSVYRTEAPLGKIGAFCGIAKPSHFYHALGDLGYEVVDTLTSQDHCLPSQEELDLFCKRCEEKGAKALLCTEKDLVKMEEYVLSLPLHVLYLDLDCVLNEKIWKEIPLRIKNRENFFSNRNDVYGK